MTRGLLGQKTTAHLREMQANQETFPNPEALGEALKDAHRAYKQKKKKQKEALKDYLNNPNCDILSDQGNKDKEEFPVGKRDVNALWNNEKSGPGTAALVNLVQGDGPHKKQFDSIPELLAAAKAASTEKRGELKDYLEDPRAPVFSEVKDKSQCKPKPEMVDRLAEESEAGPLTPLYAKELGKQGKKYGDSDDMIQPIKNMHLAKKNLDPKGTSPLEKAYGLYNSPITAAFTMSDLTQPDDVARLREYLSSPECTLLPVVTDPIKELKTPDLLNLIDAGSGIDNTIDLLEYLNDAGNKYNNVPEILAHLPEALPKKRKVKERSKALCNDKRNNLLPEPIHDKDVEDLYDNAQIGPKTALVLRNLLDDGQTFPAVEALGEALQAGGYKKKKKDKDVKAAIKDYLNSPNSSAFTPNANKDKKEVTPREVNELWRNEKSGPGTIALLNALEDAGKKQRHSHNY